MEKVIKKILPIEAKELFAKKIDFYYNNQDGKSLECYYENSNCVRQNAIKVCFTDDLTQKKGELINKEKDGRFIFFPKNINSIMKLEDYINPDFKVFYKIYDY